MWTLPFGLFGGGVRPADIIIVDTNFKHAGMGITNPSVATYLNSAQQVVATGVSNTPRFEYDGYGNYLGMLCETSVSNYIASNDHAITAYNLRSGVTQASAPIAAYFTYSTQFPAATVTTNYALRQSAFGAAPIVSVFVRMDDNSAPVVGSSSTTGDFCISTGGSGSTASIGTAPYNVTYMGGSVYRVSCTTVSGGGSNTGIFQYPTQSGKGFRVMGVMQENHTPMSSWIRTTGGTVLRSAEILTATIATIGISATTGTFFFEHDAESGRALMYVAPNTILSSQGAGKIAIAYDASGTSICYNGGTVVSGGAIAIGSQIRVGSNATGSYMDGHIKKMTWYNTKLSASELQALTA